MRRRSPASRRGPFDTAKKDPTPAPTASVADVSRQTRRPEAERRLAAGGPAVSSSDAATPVQPDSRCRATDKQTAIIPGRGLGEQIGMASYVAVRTAASRRITLALTVRRRRFQGPLMNLRSTIFLGLACVAAPTLASAYPIAADRSLDTLHASPVVYRLSDELGRVASIDDSIATAHATPDRSADGLHNRWEVKGVPKGLLHSASGDGDAAAAASAPLTVPPINGSFSVPEPATVGLNDAPAASLPLTDTSITSVVSVPEPATLGLMGLALAMLSLGSRRLGGNRQLARLLGPRQ